MKYLGIDFGLVHLGLAFADGPLAETLTEKNLPHRNRGLSFFNEDLRGAGD